MKFEEVMKINVNDKTEKKGNLTYLSWAWAWAEFKKLYPDATYSVKMFDGLPYVHDGDTGYMVFTSVTAEGITYDMWLPVMDARNKTLMNATMFDINKTIMRCLAKNLAMFGLGLYIYAGEDLPEDEQPAKSGNGGAKAAPAGKQTGDEKKGTTLEEALATRFTFAGTEYVLANLSEEWLRNNKDKERFADIKPQMEIVLKYKMLEAMNAPQDDVPFGGGNAEG